MAYVQLLRYGLPVLLVVGACWWIADSLIDIGEARVQAKWDADIAAHQKKLDRLEEQIDQKEQSHRSQMRRISNDLVTTKEEHAATLLELERSFAQQLRESEARVGVYQRLADSGAVGRANLAGYAAELDRSLVEGRQVVGELRATIVQRDQQLRALGAQIRADRELIAAGDKAQQN